MLKNCLMLLLPGEFVLNRRRQVVRVRHNVDRPPSEWNVATYLVPLAAGDTLMVGYIPEDPSGAPEPPWAPAILDYVCYYRFGTVNMQSW